MAAIECGTSSESSLLSSPTSHLAGNLDARQPWIKPLALRPVKVSEDETVQELSRPHRSNSKEQLSESSTHSLSGRGYSIHMFEPLYYQVNVLCSSPQLFVYRV
ncbi:Hypothetical protein SMAX5B_018808 [Scophthalmus maximus]|uniref:Uncharacterized protein n=1 Tax=Scophthalmus maximus TaxID=52904 RepID=A0A2U9BSL6_SCOMX|nr:Hypothetical protein SMAX5B_018808 [Scophthalmus maximus]